MATGASSIIYMSLASVLIVVVIAILAYPIAVMQRYTMTGGPPSLSQWIIIGLSIVLVLIIIAASVVVPMRKGIEALSGREF
jgi:hypothetical protein